MPSETDGSFLVLPQVILEMDLSLQLSCLTSGVQSRVVWSNYLCDFDEKRIVLFSCFEASERWLVDK